MGFRIKNRCTTSVTLVLDGIAVRIPAGDVSAIHERSLFSGADHKLLNAGLLVIFPESSNDLRQPLDKNVVASKASDRTTDKELDDELREASPSTPMPQSVEKKILRKVTNDNSITDKKSGG